jgi:transcription elongation factor Elf1
MCNEFFCPGCRHHKDVSLKGTRKAGTSVYCTSCEDRLDTLFQPKIAKTASGKVFTIASEHVRTSRINMANKRSVETANWLMAHCAD